jgi:hypothetical protein
MAEITQSYVKELLNYDPDTGLFAWRQRRGGAKEGPVKGCDNGKGYLSLQINRKRYYLHRLAWFYTHGQWPSELDHINRDKSDNRIFNLRIVSRRQNNFNTGLRKDNTSGHKGVCWYPQNRKWCARSFTNGRYIHIGIYETKEAAILAREQYEAAQ